ncbi:hypothetical protein D9611_001710 [Ephemerocybe angulata]|uniref:phytol kinase n=1 Tax=Ephemerocybe angulata TaxID=980116 RepID=A0A8H5CL09_9AGAR|nr:hypothetical protein D9611_001710 [Tulosesus angulatus]
MDRVPPPTLPLARTAAVGEEEYCARRLLANGATGVIVYLEALRDAYPYNSSDLRPLEAVMPFLRHPPRSYRALRSGPVNGIELEPVVRALLSEDWEIILSWLAIAIEYSGSLVPGSEKLGASTSIAASFLSAYTAPPFSRHAIMGDPSATVELAFRIWSGEFNEGSPLTTITVTAMIKFFSNCLDMKGSANDAVVDHFQIPHRAGAFFRSYVTQIDGLNRDSGQTEGAVLCTIGMHDLYIYLLECLSKSPNWENIWKWAVKRGALKANTESAFALIPIPSIKRWRVAQIGTLMAMAEENTEGIISKVVHLSRADMAPLLRECIRTAGDDRASKMIVRSLLEHLSSYLPYSRVSQAVFQSLEHHSANIPKASPPSDPAWRNFTSTLTFSALPSTAHKACYAFACDNLNHLRIQGQTNSITRASNPPKRKTCVACKTVFYCSTECQREDWDALHRSECSSAAKLLKARRRSHEWFPWGSKENLGAVLVHFFNFMCLAGHNVGPSDAVATIDWTMGVPCAVGSMSREDYSALLTTRRPAYAWYRFVTMLSSSPSSSTRLVEASFRHGKECIHVLATLREGFSPNGYTFLNGMGMISDQPERDDSELVANL